MVKFLVTYSCDKCKRVLHQELTASQSSLDNIRWDFNRKLAAWGGMKSERFRGATIHYCHACADGNPVHDGNEEQGAAQDKPKSSGEATSLDKEEGIAT